MGAGFLSKNICVAEKPTNNPKKMAKFEPLSNANTPMLAIMLPSTMPGAKPLTKSQRTAPRLWCARTLEIDVKMIVAIDVAMAILTARLSSTPRCDNKMVRNGTITMPPPIPNKPAKKPVQMPSVASSIKSWGWMSINGEGEVEVLNRCLQGTQGRHPEPGFRWARSD